MIILLYILVIALLISFPAETASAALHALTIWATCIVPILFPYMVFSKLLSRALSALHLPTFPISAILGMLGGSPNGAAIITANSHALSERSLLTLCMLTGTISPMFILGSISAWVDHPFIARRLLLCHWFSAIVGAWIVWMLYRNKQDSFPRKANENAPATSDVFTQSIDAVFHIGGYIILYSVLARMLRKVLYMFPAALPIIHGVFEISGGVYAICQSAYSLQTKQIIISAALGFSSLSILSQNRTMLKSLQISMRQIILFAVLRSAVSAGIMTCLTAWLPIN